MDFFFKISLIFYKRKWHFGKLVSALAPTDYNYQYQKENYWQKEKLLKHRTDSLSISQTLPHAEHPVKI